MSFHEVSENNAFSPSIQQILKDYINTLNQNKNGENDFNPWHILQNCDLAMKLVDLLISNFDFSKVDGVCILANSGIPMGVLFAQALHKPMYFYNRETWQIGDVYEENLTIAPAPEIGKSLLLFDSHIDTGFTSSDCFSVLEERGNNILGIVAPISFLHEVPETQRFVRKTHYFYLAEARDIEEILLDSFGCKSLNEIVELLHVRKPLIDDTSVFTKQMPKKDQRKALLRGLIFFPEGNQRLQKCKKNWLHKLFNSTEPEMWNIFTKPDLIEKIIKEFQSQTLSKNYELLVGTGIIGTVFILCFAWYTHFSGSILSTYKSTGWVENRKKYTGKKCMSISGRLRTGNYLRRTKSILEDEFIEIEQMVFIRFAPEAIGFPRNLLVWDFLKLYKSRIILLS